MTAEQILKKIEVLSQDEAIETNDGTHGLDPQWHTWTKMQRLDGSTYIQGKMSEAGRTRHLKHESPQSRRSQIAALQSQLAKADRDMSHNSQMARGYGR